MAILDVVVGILVGLGSATIIALVTAWWRRRPDRRSSRIRRRYGDRVDAPELQRWLLAYYDEAGGHEDLYRLASTPSRSRIAFLSRPEWSFPLRSTELSVEVAGDTVLDKSPAPLDDRVLAIWAEYIALRHADGTPWNEPLLTLQRVEDDAHLVVGCADYYQYLSTCGALELETRRALHGRRPTPLRERYASSLDQLTTVTLGAQAVGIAACVVYPDDDGTMRLFLQQRGERLATYPGTYAPVPLFGCQPTGRVSRTGASFRHNLLREFGEELLGLAENVQHADNHVHPDWFYGEGQMPQLMAALDQGELRLHELGFGFDALNGEVVVAVLCQFTSSDFVDRQRAHLQHNWEIDRFREVPLYSRHLDEQLAALEVHPGSAFAIDLARRYLRAAHPEPDPSTVR